MSGLYLPGMEMPTSCYVCPFCDYVSARCDAVNGTPYTPEDRYEKRADFCPFVPVPEHGRLGDLDELLKEVNRIYDQYDAGIISEITCMNALAWAIRNAPTIIHADPADKEGEG